MVKPIGLLHIILTRVLLTLFLFLFQLDQAEFGERRRFFQ